MQHSTGFKRDGLSRRTLLAAAPAVTAVLALPRIARAAAIEVSFTEAVHNLGYINLYVGQAAGYFEK